jgi:hypothetical protein
MFMVNCARQIMEKCEDDPILEDLIQNHQSFVEVFTSMVSPMLWIMEQDYGGEAPSDGHVFEGLDMLPMPLTYVPVPLDVS